MDATPVLAPVIVLGVEDAGELLTLQRAACVTEAQAHDDPGLRPLRQTPAELCAEPGSAAVTALGIRDRTETHRTPAGTPQLVHMRKRISEPRRR